MASASVNTMTAVAPGFLRSWRRPYRQSESTEWSQLPSRSSRTCSFTCSIPPSSIRAARSASFGGMPARMFSAISSSRWARTSWSRSTSTRRDENKFRKRLRVFAKIGMAVTSLRCFQSLCDRPGNAAPSLGFGFELLPSSFGQTAVFRAAVVLGLSPKRGNPAFFFHSVQGGKERAWLDNKSAACDLLDSAGDPQAVPFAGDQRFQDKQVQSPLQKRCRFRLAVKDAIGLL